MTPFATAADGTALGADRLAAVGPRRGAALLLHAMMVDRHSYRGERGLPGVLAAAGFDVVVADLRGRGGSPAETCTYEDFVRRDIPALLAATRALGDGPIALVGHSLGGHAGIAAAVEGALADAYVLLAANVWLPSLEPSRSRRLRKAASMAAFLTLARAAGRFPSRAVRMGPVDEARPYVEDLVRFWRDDRWVSRDGADWLAGMAGVRRPVLSVLGAGDGLLGHPDGATAWARHLPDVDVRVVGRATGLPFDPDHMPLVTDPRSAPAWTEAVGWLRGRLG